MTTKLFTCATAAAFACALMVSPAWANPEGGYGGHGGGYQKGTRHSGGGMKEMQLNLDKSRIKMEADIQVAERELKALTDDEKTEVGAIESKLKQSEDV